MATVDPTPDNPGMNDQETVLLRGAALTGTLLKDRYLLVRQLGEGGFGSVYLAQDTAMHERSVVVKIQHFQSDQDPWFERKFAEEVRALSLIDHPGVVSAIDSGRTADGKPFLVMQYVDGVTLRTVMTPEGMGLERAGEILKQVGHALAAAHEKGIWHRDLKPENLMLQRLPGGGERVRLIDFGIATVADLTANTSATRVAGSVMYMAPEQRMGQPSASADIYAMGLIAYEVLTGRKPFHSEGPGQLTAMQRAGVRLRPSELRPALTPKTERLILQSLEYEAAKRPPDARALGDQLYRELVLSDATRVTVPVRERGGDRRWLWVAAGALALIASAVTLYRLQVPGRKAAQTAVTAAPPAPAPVKPPVAPSATGAADPAAEQAIELAYWNTVKDSTEPSLYQEYLQKYPSGRFESLARAKLAILSRKTAAAVRTANAAKLDDGSAKEDERDLWYSVKGSGDPEAYHSFLNEYPSGKFAKQARDKLEQLHKNEAKQREAEQREAKRGRGGHRPPEFLDHETFLRNNPVMQELAMWKTIQANDQPEAYREYLKKYPHGLFAPIAQRKLNGGKQAPAAPAVPELP